MASKLLFDMWDERRGEVRERRYGEGEKERKKERDYERKIIGRGELYGERKKWRLEN